MTNRDMTLWDHLEELRRRLLYAALAVAIGTILAFVFRERVLDFLLAPGFNHLPDTKPIYTEVTEMVAVIMKISLMGGAVLATPIILYQLVMFVAPGLTRRERVYLSVFLPGTVVIFAVGAAFAYYVLLPPAFRFLFTFGANNADAAIRIGSYMNVITVLLFWMGVVFELPVVMFFLARLGVVSAGFLIRFRRYAVILAFVIGAIITPTMDPVNQTLIALPVIALYEVGIMLARLGQRLHHPKKSLTA